MSLLGALYIETVLKQFKKFIIFMINNQANSPICERMMQIATVLTSDSMEEAEELSTQSGLTISEVRGLYSLRIDCNL